MGAFFSRIGWMLALLPDIIRLIKAIEAAVPVAKAGKEKFDLLKDIVTDAWKESQDDKSGLSLDELVRLVTILTNRLVAFFNATGLFKTS